MPNIYLRKDSNRGKWTEEDLRRAAQAMAACCSVRKASEDYNIPRKTLERRIRNNNVTKGKMGPDSTFGFEHAMRLVRYIIKMQDSGFPFTRDDICQLAYKFAVQLNKAHKFNNETQRAGYVWLKLFLLRNPQIAIRKSENLSLARAKGINRPEIQKYFELLSSILEDNELFGSPMKIFNMDETGLQLNNRSELVLAAKGSRNVCSMSSCEKGETITLVVCCNAEGIFLPPTCIFKGKKKNPQWENEMPPGSVLFMNQKSAYINSDIFYLWLQQVFVPRKPAGKVLLILDGHGSHSGSIEMLEYAENNDIIMLSLPSHSTHYLQPLDRAVFKSLKSNFLEACRLWVKNNPGRRITRFQFGYLLSQCWGKSATPHNAISGFRATGIFPFNPTAIPDYAYAASDQQYEINEDQLTDRNANRDINKTEMAVKNVNPDEPGPSHLKRVLKPSIDTEQLIDDPQAPAFTATEPLIKDQETPSKMLENISPIPKIVVEAAKVRAKGVASILTSPDNIEICKIKDTKKRGLSQRQHLSKAKQREPVNKIPKKNIKLMKRTKNEKEILSSASEEESLDDHDESKNEKPCLICNEKGKTEIWFRCISCGGWVHKLCSGRSSAKRYICDFCQ